MIYVGIDVSKNKHDCIILNEHGEVLEKVFTITNTALGFEELKRKIVHLEPNPTNIKVGLESTGHYGFNLIGFLIKCELPIYILNPLRVRQFHNCMSLRKTKTDAVDANAIARMLISDNMLQPYTTQAYHIEELKSLTRYRFARVQERSKLKTSITRLVNTLFPELETAFSSLYGTCVSELLYEYPGAEYIAKAHITKLTKLIERASRGRFSRNKAIKLKELASNSIGTTILAKTLELKHTIKLIHELDGEINDIDKAIAKIIGTMSTPIFSIPGIGNTIGATILAEVGEFTNFASADKILAYAGFSPTTYQSGQYSSNNHARMEKRGSTYLRYALYNAAKSVCLYEPLFSEYLAKKRTEGKHYNVAISHVVKRLVRLIYSMEKYHTNYRPDYRLNHQPIH